MTSRWTLLLGAFVCYAHTMGQWQAGVLLGGGYFTPETRTAYAHEEQLCPELGLLFGMRTAQWRYGLNVIHSTRNTTDRTDDPALTLGQEDQTMRSITVGLFALMALDNDPHRVNLLAGPALDLVFPYRIDVSRTFTDAPEEDLTNAYASYTPPGLKAGLRLRAEWPLDPQWTPFGELGANYTLRQTFTDTSEPSTSTSTVTPPTDRLDYHFWLGISIVVGGPDCDCPAFH